MRELERGDRYLKLPQIRPTVLICEGYGAIRKVIVGHLIEA